MLADATWHDELLRYRQRLRTDLTSRQTGVAVVCMIFLLFLPPGVVALIYAVCVLSEVVDFYAFESFVARPSPAAHAIILANTFLSFVAYSMLGVLGWATGNDVAGFTSVLMLAGALLNVSTARAAHLPVGLAAGLPPAAGLTWIAAEVFIANRDGGAFPAVAFAPAAAFLGYTLSALVQNHRAQTRLAAETRRANEASAAKSRFLAEMSHEIRTPLNAIMGLSQALQAPAEPPAVAAQAATIESAARTLGMLVEDVLDLASAEEGRLRNRPVTASIRDELCRVAASRAIRGQAAAAPPVAFTGEVPDLGRFDPVLLRKLLTHVAALLRWHCGCDGPPVALACGPAPAAGLVRIVLDAAGMAAPPAPGTEGPGGALAAALVERIAAILGARIEWTLAGGRPVAAAVLLPVTALPDLPAPGSVEGERRLQALVVDDLATNRFVIVQLLRMLRIEAIEAESGPAALACLEKGAPDIVLLDMNMPGMSGEATFRAIRSASRPWSDVPVIAVTADALPEQRDACMALGLDGYVPKPVDRRLLWAEICAATAPDRRG
ncbi:MAG: response regulator [Rhodobacteraceae bacterium]|nr:response regulator [Paracoccaceae bacterium]